MAYPSSLDSLRTDLAGTDDAAVVDHAGLHNAVNAAVMAVQAELGLDPSGAAATVAARLASIEADARWIGNLLPGTLARCTSTAGITRNTVIATTVTPVVDGIEVASSSTYVGAFIGCSANSTAWTPPAGTLPVGPEGTPMTALIEVSSATMTEVSEVLIAFQDSGGVQVGTATATFILSASRQTVRLTAIVPAGAVKAALRIRTANTGSGARAFTLHRLSWHVGAGGVWVPPAVPVPNLGILPVAGPVPQAKMWADGSWAPQPVIIGSGSPQGIVVPDFKGQKFVDTEQTLGAREWVATGTTAASWVVSDGDTGWRNLLPLAATITDLTVFRLDICRIGKTVVLDMQVAATALTSGTLLTAAQLAGWLPRGARIQRYYRATNTVPGTQSIDLAAHSTLGLTIASQGNTNGNIRAEHSWTTADPWPTAAPV